MDVSFLAAALIPLVLYVWLFTIPLCDAFLEGIKAAADPNARVAPGSPWFFFDRAVRRRLRRWKRVWRYAFLVMSVFAVAIAIYFDVVFGGFIFFVVSILWRLLGFAAMTFLTCVHWSPRCEQLWVLVLLVLSSALVGFAALALITTDTTIIVILLAIGAWWRARQLDERWFRFSE